MSGPDVHSTSRWIRNHNRVCPLGYPLAGVVGNALTEIALPHKGIVARDTATRSSSSPGCRSRSSLAHVSYRGPKPDSWMVIPRADSSLSNCFTAGEISLFPGTITAHSKFSLNSRVMISHWPRWAGIVAPI